MDTKSYLGAVRRAADYLRQRAPRAKAAVGVILGSGLSKSVPALESSETIPYSQIPGFPRTTVAGHEGRLILGRFAGSEVAVMQGRFHYYEGHPMEAIALPLRVLESLGMKTLLITSAVGAMNPRIRPGDLTVIADHINLMGVNPLRAFHQAEFGTMFPDLTGAYDPALRRLALSVCRKKGIPAREGVYFAVGGPSYETPAEIRAFRRLGGDVVGMSLVPEAIAARQIGVKVLAVAWTSNRAAGLPGSALSHPDVLALGEKVSERLRGLLEELLRRLPR